MQLGLESTEQDPNMALQEGEERPEMAHMLSVSYHALEMLSTISWCNKKKPYADSTRTQDEGLWLSSLPKHESNKLIVLINYLVWEVLP